jgi:two-component system chemotaxis response regulator CheB
LFRHLPADPGVAIVIVNHPGSVATRVPDILPRFTAMPVASLTARLLIRPHRVFIISTQRDLPVPTCPDCAIADGGVNQT